MANADLDYDYEDDDDFESSDLPKKLRRQIKELQKQVASLSEENGSMKGAERKRSIGSTLQEKGLNPKIAAFVPQDLSAEEIDTWLSEYGDVFGGGSPAAPQEGHEPQIVANAEQAAAIRQMANVEAAGSSAPSGDVLAQIANAQNMDELMAVIRG